ncbi:MAG TPA: HAD-IA family hydrolase [Bryobacteraceae bacterium]|nr:HAD-IA family hydrolase [Bryobacteraceae bacterium]
MTTPTLVFDMDGVLVDVTESYREAIAQTVEHFTGARISNEEIQGYKNQGGWNDDWQLSHHIVKKAGIATEFGVVKEYFQSIFSGQSGLIMREKWVAQPGRLEKLNRSFKFALFTGRPKAEAEFTLRRFAPELLFDPIVGMYEVTKHKPEPEGLLQIQSLTSGCKLYYVGDTVDDARCARAAGVPFIGIAAPENPRYLDLVFLFQAEGAQAIVDDINYLEEVFAA